jgi:hypothetical protein
MRVRLAIFVSVGLLAAGLRAGPPPEVAVTVSAEPRQPAGGPVLVEVTITHVGGGRAAWLTAGPGDFLGAEHFAVGVVGEDDAWHEITPTNGQYQQWVSAVSRSIGPGERAVVPLAVPAGRKGFLSVRVWHKTWHAAAAADVSVEVVDDAPDLVHERRTKLLKGVVAREAFARHVAAGYPEAGLDDALMKLAAIDDPWLAGAALSVLAERPFLPEAAGEVLAAAMTRWLGRAEVPTELNEIRHDAPRAAARTDSPAFREALLAVLRDPPNGRARAAALDALPLTSRADRAWLDRLHATLAGLDASDPSVAAALRVVRGRIDALGKE